MCVLTILSYESNEVFAILYKCFLKKEGLTEACLRAISAEDAKNYCWNVLTKVKYAIFCLMHFESLLEIGSITYMDQ